VEFVVASNRDVVTAKPGDRIPDSGQTSDLSGVVDSGAARLVLPQRVVDELQLQLRAKRSFRYADRRRERRPSLATCGSSYFGRHGVFSAVVEPDRDKALIGAIVLEELDLVVDCGTQSLYPREPDSILTEIE